jgi:hypothetical protein
VTAFLKFSSVGESTRCGVRRQRKGAELLKMDGEWLGLSGEGCGAVVDTGKPKSYWVCKVGDAPLQVATVVAGLREELRRGAAALTDKTVYATNGTLEFVPGESAMRELVCVGVWLVRM